MRYLLFVVVVGTAALLIQLVGPPSDDRLRDLSRQHIGADYFNSLPADMQQIQMDHEYLRLYYGR